MTTLYVDVETRSPVPIKHGTYRYAEQSEILLVSWAVDGGPPYVDDWTMPRGLPDTGFMDAWIAADRIVAHNANFDRVVLARHGFTARLEKWECTMARALAHSLPGSLEHLCAIYQMADDIAKLKIGKRLIQLFCTPRKLQDYVFPDLYDEVDGAWFATSRSHPKDWQEFIQYGRQDIPPLRVLDQKLPRWNWRPEDIAAWHRNQRINDFGMLIDEDLAHAAIRTVDQHKKGLQARTDALVGEGVDLAVSQRDALLQHLTAAYGVQLPDLRAATLERRLEDPSLPDDVAELLRIRLSYCQTSTTKWNTLVRSVCKDGRLRGTAQYCGASRTGRDGGRIFQPLNLPRPSKRFAGLLPQGIDAVVLGIADLVDEDPIELCSAALRGAIIAPPGRKLLVADYNAIEGRFAAWFSDERWKLNAYRAGKDLYVETYAEAWRVPPSKVDDAQRQEGKVMELACQYGGSIGALDSMGAIYGVRFEDEQKLVVVRAWRKANPEIVSTWYELDDALASIITSPNGREIPVRKCVVRKQGAWVRVILPSGRSLSYPNMRFNEDGEICFQGVNQYTRKWEEIRTWGSRVYENIVQAGSRDVLVHGMARLEEDPLDIELTIYDEVVAEADPDYPVSRFCERMTIVPPWADGLPLVAKGFETQRYEKR